MTGGRTGWRVFRSALLIAVVLTMHLGCLFARELRQEPGPEQRPFAAPSEEDDPHWRLIAESIEHVIAEDVRTGRQCREQAEFLVERLSREDVEAIRAFDRFLWEQRIRAFDHGVHAACTIIHGECPDDRFAYFRAWLIVQGRVAFDETIERPDRMAGWAPSPSPLRCEPLLHVAEEAYEERSGGERLPPTEIAWPEAPSGAPFTEEYLPERYPALCARFGCEEVREQAPTESAEGVEAAAEEATAEAH